MEQFIDDVATPESDKDVVIIDTPLDADEYPIDDFDISEPEMKRQRGAVTRPDGRVVVGRVGAPPQQEATSGTFHFWVAPDALVERTQIVTCESIVGSQTFTFYALVEEVRRQSYKRNMRAEIDEADGDLTYIPPLNVEGFTYATASILRVMPRALTPPRERSEVILAGPQEAQLAYEADEIEKPMIVGLDKNGGEQVAGPGAIDLDYLLGANGGHMNVNGAAGRGTKSSFLMYTNWQLLRRARAEAKAAPSSEARLCIVPIILNVKNFDLFYLDRPSNRFNPAKDLSDWQDIGVDNPTPFTNVVYYAPQQPRGSTAIATGRTIDDVKPYSWSLSDIIERGLLSYLFASEDVNDANFGALILDLENWLTNETVADNGTVTRSLREKEGGQPQTFAELLGWIKEQAGKKDSDRKLKEHHTGTWRKVYRRMMKVLFEAKGVLRREDQQGNPLDVVYSDTTDPIVIDLSALASEPALQRFVVATIFSQLVEARTGANAVAGLIYVVTLDELNRFAPRGAHDPITQLVEMVAAEMRSQGIILLGAQQQASKVSERVIENAGIRVLGKTGTLELSSPTWRSLTESARRKAETLGMDEKLVIQDNFREPLHVRVPRPIWAMNPREAQSLSESTQSTETPTARNFFIDN